MTSIIKDNGEEPTCSSLWWETIEWYILYSISEGTGLKTRVSQPLKNQMVGSLVFDYVRSQPWVGPGNPLTSISRWSTVLARAVWLHWPETCGWPHPQGAKLEGYYWLGTYPSACLCYCFYANQNLNLSPTSKVWLQIILHTSNITEYIQFCDLLWLKQHCAKSDTNPFHGFPTILVRSQNVIRVLCQGPSAILVRSAGLLFRGQVFK